MSKSKTHWPGRPKRKNFRKAKAKEYRYQANEKNMSITIKKTMQDFACNSKQGG